MTIYFMRHARYVNNELEITNTDPTKIIDLSEKGLEQIKNKEKLNINFDILISSQFFRCKKTLSLYLNRDIKEIIEDKRINELQINEDGIPYDKLRKLIRSQIFFKKYEKRDEKIIDRIKILREFILDIKTKYKNKNIIICTHNDILKLIKIINENLDLKEFVNIKVENVGLYKFE